MAADKERYDMHLTPRGWVNGTTRIGWGAENVVPRPPDAVLTLRFSEITSSMYGGVSRYTHVEYTCGDAEAIKALEQKFGARPEEYKNWG